MRFIGAIDALRAPLCAYAVLAFLCAATFSGARSAMRSHFEVSSSDPQLAISVPLIYTAKAFGCTGGNLSPPLHWSGAPIWARMLIMGRARIREILLTTGAEARGRTQLLEQSDVTHASGPGL
jgi:hypothetical protein